MGHAAPAAFFRAKTKRALTGIITMVMYTYESS
jgi:hypothetical protein